MHLMAPSIKGLNKSFLMEFFNISIFEKDFIFNIQDGE